MTKLLGLFFIIEGSMVYRGHNREEFILWYLYNTKTLPEFASHDAVQQLSCHSFSTERADTVHTKLPVVWLSAHQYSTVIAPQLIMNINGYLLWHHGIIFTDMVCTLEKG